MADETQGKAAQADGTKTSKLVLRLLILSILIMIATPLITIFAFRAMSQEVIAANEVKPMVTEIALPRIQVNVADTQGTRYAQVEVVVTISDSSMAPLFEKQSESNPNGHQREIVAAVIQVVGDKPLNALLPTEGKEALANELKATLNNLLADYTSGMITDVYFYGFLIQ